MLVRMSIAFLSIALISGCMAPAKKIQPGESVMLNYTCSIPEKGVVETNQEAVAKDEGSKKSRVFFKRSSYNPMTLVAGEDQPGQRSGDLKYLSPEIRTRLAHALVGKFRGRTYDITIESEVPEGIEDRHRYRYIERVRTVKKIQTLTRKDFIKGKHRDPVVGEVFSEDGKPYAKVIAADEKHVKLQLIVDEKTTYEVPWGRARESTAGDEVKVFIETEVGTPVRTGGLIGRVSEINEKYVIIDYGHPFAGYPLNCKVKIQEDPKEVVQ